MREIVVPPSVKLTRMSGEAAVNESGKQLEMSFYDFVFAQLEDPAFCATAMMVEKALAIAEVVREAQLGSLNFVLEEDHWQMLKQVTERPATGYTRFAHNAIHFMQAIINAPQVKRGDS